MWSSDAIWRHRPRSTLTEVILGAWEHKAITSTNVDLSSLTHWGRVMRKCVSKLTIIDAGNGLSPGRRKAIIWPNAVILLIWTLGTDFSEILSEIHTFSFKKMPLKMSSAKWRPFCFGLNVLRSSNIQLRLKNGSVANTITWTNVDQVPWRHMALLNHNELTNGLWMSWHQTSSWETLT